MSNLTQKATLLDFILQPNQRWIGITSILSIFYAVGIAGILIPLHKDFLLLTPFNLLLSLALVYWNHQPWTASTWGFIGLSYVVGFGAELFGVQTGLLFGNYEYGPVLGWQIWGTPLMIGVNWLIVGYCSGVLVNHLLPGQSVIIKSLVGALLMVALDVLIEPVAMAYDFWQWEGNSIPLKNYVGWLMVAFPLQLYFATFQGNIKNKAAISLFILQVIFFAILRMATLI